MRAVITFIVTIAIAVVLAMVLDCLGLGFKAGVAFGTAYMLVAAIVLNTWAERA